MRYKKSIITKFIYFASLVVLLVTTIFFYSKVYTLERQLAETQHSYSSPELPNTFPVIVSQAANSMPNAAAGEEVIPDHDTESKVISAAEGFLQAYFGRDTARPETEYVDNLVGHITANGRQNLASNTTRPSKADAELRIERKLYQCKVYIRTQGKKDATAFCIAYVKQTLTVRGNEPVEGFDPIMIRVELKQEADDVWRTNVVSLERSLGAFPMNYNELFS